MLLIPTFLSKSDIQGIGLFADCDIPTGTIIWKYDDATTNIYSKLEWETLRMKLPEIAFENIFRFSYLRHDKWLLTLDDGRFMNHSGNPNTGYDQVAETCFALRDIAKGEELTVRYGEFCEIDDPDYCLLCGICGEKSCHE